MIGNSNTCARGGVLLAAAALLVAATLSAGVAAQGGSGSDALRRDVESRFEVLPLQNGLALRPKSAERGVRSVELTNGTLAIDGTPVSGGELRDKLGADADLVLRLSYLEPAERRALFSAPRAAEPDAPGTTVGPESRATEAPARRRSRSSDTRVRLGGDVTIGPDEIVNDDVVVIGGTARVDGQVRGDVVVILGGTSRVDGQVRGDVVIIGGTGDLGEHADVSGDVVVVGGALRRDPGAHVGGQISEIGLGALGRHWRAVPLGAWWWGPTWRGRWGDLFGLVPTVVRLAVLWLLASLVVFLARGHVERIGARAAATPIKAGAVGLLAQLLFLPLLIVTILVFVVTIVGIPLLLLIPFALLVLAIVFLVGFTAVSYALGRLVSVRMGWPTGSPYLITAIGVTLVISPVLVGRLCGLVGGVLFPLAAALLVLGFLFEYLVWTIGFGAAALVRFGRSRTTPPPPLPSTA